jgi:hypothetical protein
MKAEKSIVSVKLDSMISMKNKFSTLHIYCLNLLFLNF